MDQEPLYVLARPFERLLQTWKNQVIKGTDFNVPSAMIREFEELLKQEALRALQEKWL